VTPEELDAPPELDVLDAPLEELDELEELEELDAPLEELDELDDELDDEVELPDDEDVELPDDDELPGAVGILKMPLELPPHPARKVASTHAPMDGTVERMLISLLTDMASP
jgi:hypothetical protein